MSARFLSEGCLRSTPFHMWPSFDQRRLIGRFRRTLPPSLQRDPSDPCVSIDLLFPGYSLFLFQFAILVLDLQLLTILATLLPDRRFREHVEEFNITHATRCRHGIASLGPVWIKMQMKSEDCGTWSEKEQRRLIVWWYVFLIFLSTSVALYLFAFDFSFSCLYAFEPVYT